MEALEFLKETQRLCKEYSCSSCPVGEECVLCVLEDATIDSIRDFVSAIEQRSKEHPLVTNRMKIREVFGDESMYTILSPNMQALIDWLDAPYKEHEHERERT